MLTPNVDSFIVNEDGSVYVKLTNGKIIGNYHMVDQILRLEMIHIEHAWIKFKGVWPTKKP